MLSPLYSNAHMCKYTKIFLYNMASTTNIEKRINTYISDTHWGKEFYCNKAERKFKPV